MQATIIYLLSEQAQRAQMVATGHPVARKQTVVEEVPAEMLSSWAASIDADGGILFDLGKNVGITEAGEISGRDWGYACEYAPFDSMPESGLAAIRTRLAQVEIKCMELRSAYARRQVELAEREERQRQQRIVDAERREAEQASLAAIEQAKQDYIAAWVAERGGDILRAQFADGLACRKTIISMIADAAFSDFGVPDAAPDSVVCRDSDCPCSDKEVDCLPPAAYEHWREMRSKLPEGSTAEFRKIRDCLREDGSWPGDEDGVDSASAPYYVAEIKIKMPHGPFTFERRVRL